MRKWRLVLGIAIVGVLCILLGSYIYDLAHPYVPQIPIDLDDSHRLLESLLSKKQLKAMSELTSEEDMVQYHFSLGLWIRNNWIYPDGSPLAESLAEMGLTHPDDMSGLILDTFWCKLHDRPFELEKRVQKYKDYWRSVAEERNAQQAHSADGR